MSINLKEKFNIINNKYNKLFNELKQKNYLNYCNYINFVNNKLKKNLYEINNPPFFKHNIQAIHFINNINMISYRLLNNHIKIQLDNKTIKDEYKIVLKNIATIENNEIFNINYSKDKDKYRYLKISLFTNNLQINTQNNNTFIIHSDLNKYIEEKDINKEEDVKYNKIFTNKVDLLYVNLNIIENVKEYINKCLNILNKNGILILYKKFYNETYNNIINEIKKNFKFIEFHTINLNETYLILYNYKSIISIKNTDNLYINYLKTIDNNYNNLLNEYNKLKKKQNDRISNFYLEKLIKILDEKHIEFNVYYRRIWYYKNWHNRIKLDKNKEIQILEIGVYKAEMSIWFINNLLEHDKSRIYLVDTWQGSVEYNEDFEQVYLTYKKNIKLSKYPEKAIENRITSLLFMCDFIKKHNKAFFDLIYIDACHDSRCVMADAMLAWKLLKVGGYLIFDDYSWNLLIDQPDYVRPKLAVDDFLNLFRDNINIIHMGYKVYLIKTSEYKL